MQPAGSSRSRAERPWWYHPEITVIALLAWGIYFSRLTALPVCGEEPRRALVAVEMKASGDWIVPRQQGQRYFSRPPLQNWLIGLAGWVRGDVDRGAIRLPSALAILLTALLVYGYGRTFLSRFGAMSAAVVFLTLGQVLQIGNLGETEALFTLLVSGSLLLWHWGYVAGWPRVCTWIAGGTLAGAAALTKGLQGPLYFFAAVGVFLVLRRDWRAIFAWQPLVGAAAFAGVVTAWQVPYYLATDLGSVRRIWTGLVAERLTLGGLLSHMITYPVETLACLLPWSPLLLQFIDRRVRESIGRARPHLVFLGTALAVTYPTVWLAAGAVNRYYMPMYPCIALVIGLAVQRSLELEPTSLARGGWNRFLLGTAVAAACGGLFVLAASVLRVEKLEKVAQEPMFAAVFALASVMTVAILLRVRAAGGVRGASVAVVALAGFVGLAYTGAVVNSQVGLANDPAPIIAELKQSLPHPGRLVSFGRVHHLFRYYYRAPIRPLGWPETEAHAPRPGAYFCINAELARDNPPTQLDGHPAYKTKARDLPFRWEEVSVIPCGRHRTDRRQAGVVVGRVLPSSAGLARSTRGDGAARR